MNNIYLKKEIIFHDSLVHIFSCSTFHKALTNTILSNLCDNSCDNPCDRPPIIAVDREDATDSSVEIFSLIQPKRE